MAVVYLTRRQDLIVTDETGDFGVDLSVTLNLAKNEGHRKFGVELRGSLTAATADQANRTLYPSMQRMLRYGPPVSRRGFCFAMGDNEGWYTWASEPVVSANGDFEIVQHGEASCRRLNTEAIDEIVEAVDRWYDAFFAKATREAPTRKHNGSSARR